MNWLTVVGGFYILIKTCKRGGLLYCIDVIIAGFEFKSRLRYCTASIFCNSVSPFCNFVFIFLEVGMKSDEVIGYM